MNIGFDCEASLLKDGMAHPACLVLGRQKGTGHCGGWKVYPDGFNLEIGSEAGDTCCAFVLDAMGEGLAQSLDWAQRNEWELSLSDCNPICQNGLPQWPPEALISGCNPTRDAFADGRQRPVFRNPRAYRDSLIEFGSCCGSHLHFEIGKYSKEFIVRLVKAVVKSSLATSMLMVWDESSRKRFEVLGVGKFRYRREKGILEFKDFGSNIMRSHWNAGVAVTSTRSILEGALYGNLDLNQFDEISDEEAIKAFTEGNTLKIKQMHDFTCEVMNGVECDYDNFYDDSHEFVAVSTCSSSAPDIKRAEKYLIHTEDKWCPSQWLIEKRKYDMFEFAFKKKDERNLYDAWMMWLGDNPHYRGAMTGLIKHNVRYS